MAQNQKLAIYPSLIDRIVVITGGAMGIGACMVEHFALQGSKVLVLDVAEDDAKLVLENVSKLNVKYPPVFYNCDVSDVEGALKSTAAKILQENPKIHVLINNAAMGKAGEFLPTVTLQSWDNSIALNLRPHVFLTQALLPGLLSAAGISESSRPDESFTSFASVINMGSISWAIPATGVLPYTTSKAAIVGLTRTLAHELGPQGVRVNSIMPGSIATEREKREMLTPEYEARVLGSQAIKRLIRPIDVTKLALWLAADDSSGVTNQSIRVDGGWT